MMKAMSLECSKFMQQLFITLYYRNTVIIKDVSVDENLHLDIHSNKDDKNEDSNDMGLEDMVSFDSNKFNANVEEDYKDQAIDAIESYDFSNNDQIFVKQDKERKEINQIEDLNLKVEDIEDEGRFHG